MSFWIRDMKTELGITVLMVEHDMTLVNRVSDRVIALNYGRCSRWARRRPRCRPSRRRRRLSRRMRG
jgi:ABC-type glutathione transport system ATPase component